MNIYNQLYEIIGDAVFGEAVLNASQEFVLTQICTYMSFAVVLLPVVAVIAITVKLLKW